MKICTHLIQCDNFTQLEVFVHSYYKTKQVKYVSIKYVNKVPQNTTISN